MCDYSLHLVASRPAQVGDKLVATDFARSITRGFSAVGQPDVAVCLLPGTEIAFDEEVQYDRAFSLFGKARVEHKVARFRQVNMDDPHVHHDAPRIPRRPDRDGDAVDARSARHSAATASVRARAKPLQGKRSAERAVGRADYAVAASARRDAMPDWLGSQVCMGGEAGLHRSGEVSTRRLDGALAVSNDNRRVSVIPRPRHAGHAGLLHHPNVRFDAARHSE